MKKSRHPYHIPSTRGLATHFHRDPSPNAPDSDLPGWLRGESDGFGLPEGMKQAVAHIVLPAYRAFVLEAPGELERSVGNSVVYLTWLELVNQIRLANTLAESTGTDAILFDPDELTDRYLQLVTAKCQAAGLMLKIRFATEAINSMSPVHQAFRPDPPVRQAFQPDSQVRPAFQPDSRVRQAFQPDPCLLQEPAKLETDDSVDQLSIPVP